MAESLVNLREVRRALGEARGKRKLDLILSAPDPEALVAALPPEELYFAILDVGSEDAAELVAFATPDQFRHFVDMSAWPRSDEGPETKELVRWLELSREGAEGNPERFKKQIAGLDNELLSLLLRREIHVHELSDDEQPEPENPGMTYYSPDRRYMLEFQGGAGYAAMKNLVDELYAEDPIVASRLLESTRWDLPTQLEESARRWRDGRLRDLGVPPFEEAISFYARPAASAAGTAPSGGTALTVPSRPLLDAALDQLTGDELELAEEGLIYASNAALVANRTQLADPDDIRDQLVAARSTLSLGLEVLSGGDPVRAARLLVERPAREIFQAGMGDAYRLQTRARRIAAATRLPQAKTVTLLDPPLGAVVDALLRMRPAFHEPGARRPRAFGSRAEVLQAELLLDEAEGTASLLGKLGLSPAELGSLLDAAQLAPTALKASSAVRALVEARLTGAPFSLSTVGDSDHRSPEGFAAKVVEVLGAAAQTDAERRAADRLRAALS